jgi:hypothetical protein
MCIKPTLALVCVLNPPLHPHQHAPGYLVGGGVEWPLKGRMSFFLSFYHNSLPKSGLFTLSTYTTGLFSKILYFMVYLPVAYGRPASHVTPINPSYNMY